MIYKSKTNNTKRVTRLGKRGEIKRQPNCLSNTVVLLITFCFSAFYKTFNGFLNVLLTFVVD